MRLWTDDNDRREAVCQRCGASFVYVNRNPARWCPACRPVARKGHAARRRLETKEHVHGQ